MNPSASVLVIDDDPALLAAMVRMLEKEGFDVETVSCGEEALEKVHRFRPDLMICDVVLPDMNGIEVFQQARALWEDIPVILVSSVQKSSEEQVFGLEQGVCEYIARPMPNREFVARVKSVYASSAAKAKLKAQVETVTIEARTCLDRLHVAQQRIEAQKAEIDSTHRVRIDMEETLKAVFSHAPFCIFFADGDARIYQANEALSKWVGLDRNLLMGHRCGSVFGCVHAGDDPAGCGRGSFCPDCKLRNSIETTYKTGLEIPLEEAELVDARDGQEEIRTVALSANRVTISGQQLVLVCMVDITERKRLEQEKARLQMQLNQAQKIEAIGRLAAGVAHDFKNLLAVMLGYGELMQAELPAEHPRRAALDAIVSAANKGKELTRQLLAFSRKQSLEVKIVDLNQIVTGFQSLIRRLIGEDIALVVHVHPRPISVRVDVSRIEQVLMNLCVNAKDAMPDGGSLIIETGIAQLDPIQAQKHAEPLCGRYAMVSVSDTGSGMNAETIERIFEPFFTTKPKDRGTGLGLATAYGIIKQHGGTIWVYSEPGKGSEFKVFLPLSAEDAEKPLEVASLAAQACLSSGTVMVVEDDVMVRELVVSILSRAGYRVLEPHDAAQAFEMAKNHTDPIHLVLCDVIMPGMKGPQVFEILSACHPEARVLYMSGYTKDVIGRHGILDSEICFISKPFSMEGLLSKVAEMIRS
jgi:signal transduction histidine kinase/DNA-binding response OmpR family regulator